MSYEKSRLASQDRHPDPPVPIWHQGLIARLEPRLMFDGALGDTAVQTTDFDSPGPDDALTEEEIPVSQGLPNTISSGSGREIAVIDRAPLPLRIGIRIPPGLREKSTPGLTLLRFHP